MLNSSFPAQQLSFRAKNKVWRKRCVDWADQRSYYYSSLVRKSIEHKQINYDLANGIIHMHDIERILNPDEIKGLTVPEKIQHYSIIKPKLDLLSGEEQTSQFDFHVVVSNANAISEKEEAKKQEAINLIQGWFNDGISDESQNTQAVQRMNEYLVYEWQDMREIRANQLLNHYCKELELKKVFGDGFKDALICGEEIYQCDIVSGEPVVRKLNPLKVRVFKSGYSNRIEDADIIIIEDYWSPGKVIDAFYDVLSDADRKYIEEIPFQYDASSIDDMGGIDERQGFANKRLNGDREELFYWDPLGEQDGLESSLQPYDTYGNVRVTQVYWKSRRKIKKVFYFDENGSQNFDFFPETYECDKTRGETEEIYWINEAWEGTKIGEKIYVNMRPRQVQYNRMSNPSRCHFGIIGSIYNLNDSRPFSMVDLMKPYAYLYDVIADRLNKLIARSWGNLIRLDLSKKPNGWGVDKWLYYAKTMGIAVEDSFNEGQIGASTGKLAGSLNNGSSGFIPAGDQTQIQYYLNLLNFIKEELSSTCGISRQREGQVENRETMGGVERSTHQSSNITKWLFVVHDSVKKRVLECLIETAKIALRGRKEKFQYILSDASIAINEIDGDAFAEADYGIVVVDQQGFDLLNQNLDSLAQAALQNQVLNFSSVMKLFTMNSVAEKQRAIEKAERDKEQAAQQQQQQEQQMQQQMFQMQEQAEEKKRQHEILLAKMNNETKLEVAKINAMAESERLAIQAKDQEILTQKEINKQLEKDKDRQSREKIAQDEHQTRRDLAAMKEETKRTEINSRNDDV